MIIKKEDVVQGGKVQIPMTLGRVRIAGVKSKDTAAKEDRPSYPMTVLECEVIEPEQIEHNGAKINLAGRKFFINCLHWSGEPWGQATFDTFAKKLGHTDGYDAEGNYNTAAFESLKGWEFDYFLSTPTEDVKRAPRLPGEKLGKPLVDATGKQMSNGWPIHADLGNVPDNCRPTKVQMPF